MATLTEIRIIGPSMSPTLRNQEHWLGLVGGKVRPGNVIAFYEPGRPNFLATKRISHATADGWWVVADNPVGAVASDQFGAVPFDAVVARLLFRTRPLFRRS